MTSLNTLAFDIGASSGRAVIGHYDGARITLQEVHRFPNHTVPMRGHLRWDTPRLFEEMSIGLQKAKNICTVATIGIDTWGVDGGFLGPHDEFLGLPFGYRDFSEENMKECWNNFSADQIYDITGIQFMPFNTLYQFYRHQKLENILMQVADRFLFTPDLLRYLFTGEKHTEYTIASTSQMLDARTGKWSQDILDFCNLSSSFMGEIVPPGTICGTVEGTDIQAIAVGGHDTASAVLAVPADETDSWLWLSSGTWSLMGIETNEPFISLESRAYNFSNEGGVGSTIRFLKNIMGLWLEQECRRMWKHQGNDFSFDELAAMVKDTPPNGPVIDANALRFMAPDDMCREIQDACRESGQPVPNSPGEIERCILESLAAAYAKTRKELEEVTQREYTTLHIVGGGSQNTLLNQMTADACKMRVVTGPIEATALGNIAMQLIATGHISSIAEAREVIRHSFSVTEYLPQNA